MIEKKKVALKTGPDRMENIWGCLELIRDDLKNIKKAQNILIKPNLVAIKPEYSNTHVDAVEAVIKFIRQISPDSHITIGESSGSAFYNKISTAQVFLDYNYDRLEKKYKRVRLQDFDNEKDFIQSPILSVVGDTHLRIARRIESFDYIVSLSIPKTHNFAMVTLGIKNMAGLVHPADMATIHGMKGGIEVDAPKTFLDHLPSGTVSKARRILPNWFINFLFRKYPSYKKSVKMIHHNIAELAKRTWPDLVILDGFICMEGDGPIDGTPVQMNTAIASTDPVKADGIGARLMGFQPEDIGYLFYLQEEEWGEYSLDNLLGDSLEKTAKKFKPHGTIEIQRQWKE